MATKGNRFKKEPTVDMNDPAALLTAGKTRENATVPAQEKPEKEERVVTPPKTEKPQEGAQTSSVGFDLKAFEEKQKKAQKDDNKVNTSFTISPEVHTELKRRYKKAGFKSASTYLDSILKAVFGIED